MSGFFYGAAHQPHVNSHSSHNHHGRSRRNPRGMGPQKQQFRPARTTKDVVEAAQLNAFRRDFEAAKSFELEDDELFCPFHLLTEYDLQTISSCGSDRSSLSSGSPESSPLQHQLQPTPSFVLSTSQSFGPSAYHHNSHPKLHQPLAQKTRNPIPIVDPTTRAVASPPQSGSPGRQMHQQYMNRRY